MSEERSSMLDKMLGSGAAASLRGKVQNTKKKLDAAGLEHKAAKSQEEAKTKGMIDAMRAKVEAFVGRLMDSPPDGITDGIMAIVTQSAMETPVPTEETAPAVEEAPMGEMAEDDMMPIDEEDEEEMEGDFVEDEEEKALAHKATSLFDGLITTQEGLATDLNTLTKAVSDLAPLLALVEEVQALKQTVGKLEKQLSNRPRMASRASETEVEKGDLPSEIQKHLVQKDRFWGVELTPEGM